MNRHEAAQQNAHNALGEAYRALCAAKNACRAAATACEDAGQMMDAAMWTEKRDALQAAIESDLVD